MVKGIEAVMDSLSIELHRHEIVEFCTRWKVIELSLFGSAVRGELTLRSDIDVLVRFENDLRPRLTELDEMSRELSRIFSRSVDLVERTAVESNSNYIRRQHILQSAEPVYVARPTLSRAQEIQ
jgi:predicted nucleotidyltransferase